MTYKFRCVQTLHTGNSAAKSTRIVNPQLVFKDVGSFGQETEKELGGSIFGGLVITCAFFPCAARKLVNRFEAGSPKVFECPVLPDMFFNCNWFCTGSRDFSDSYRNPALVLLQILTVSKAGLVKSRQPARVFALLFYISASTES